jgi:hypothetical protein
MAHGIVTKMKDQIVSEVRQACERQAAKFGYNLKAIMAGRPEAPENLGQKNCVFCTVSEKGGLIRDVSSGVGRSGRGGTLVYSTCSLEPEEKDHSPYNRVIAFNCIRRCHTEKLCSGAYGNCHKLRGGSRRKSSTHRCQPAGRT